MKRRIGKFVGLIIVTIFALAVMYVSGGRNQFFGAPEPVSNETKPLTPSSNSLAPVTLMQLHRQPLEILDSYAGTIQPLESFSLAFQLAGRVESLGKTAEGKTLDVGDRVTAGQVLAQLDTRILRSRRDEANANLENAQTEYQRLANLQQRSPGVVSETSFQQATQQLAVSKAMQDISEKNLEDALLIAPEDGVISKRLVNAGESINMHQAVFEIVQVDKVLLTVGVPESRIIAMQRQFNQKRRKSEPPPQPGFPNPVSDFKVYVRRFDTSSNLEGSTVLAGTVYRMAETASDGNGLFEVEVLLDNPNRLLKPGLVAKADFVIRELDGYQIPVESVVFNDRTANLFFAVVSPENPTTKIDLAGMELAEMPNLIAQQIEIPSYIEQGRNFILPSIPGGHELLVVQGQHRLVEGRPLEVMGAIQSNTTPLFSPTSGRVPMTEVSRLETENSGK
ncbi:efflux RND transporter periplasmic adaptor subunit [Bremerella cremea]|uniref:Efflux RND transporter periplasmic adaptor subunit n=1 Tax=Bremerella cremea TaxID=1031537 RepID=A0A368KV97_9BACT|nr:efflux RND transporter periplasmic adaptor subunit [Bremerella cremea]RCS54353.1 efflux RND transporter periplasmic adaptor subunit [Bremerella cremea]